MDKGKKELNSALDGLEVELPDRAARGVRWLRHPRAKWVRLPLGIFFIVCSFFWFVPGIGLELLPLGLLLVAVDVPFLRKPVGRFVLWLEGKWRRFKARWQQWRRASPSQSGAVTCKRGADDGPANGAQTACGKWAPRPHRPRRRP